MGFVRGGLRSGFFWIYWVQGWIGGIFFSLEKMSGVVKRGSECGWGRRIDCGLEGRYNGMVLVLVWRVRDDRIAGSAELVGRIEGELGGWFVGKVRSRGVKEDGDRYVGLIRLKSRSIRGYGELRRMFDMSLWGVEGVHCTIWVPGGGGGILGLREWQGRWLRFTKKVCDDIVSSGDGDWDLLSTVGADVGWDVLPECCCDGGLDDGVGI